jgi:hypothetical protein
MINPITLNGFTYPPDLLNPTTLPYRIPILWERINRVAVLKQRNVHEGDMSKVNIMCHNEYRSLTDMSGQDVVSLFRGVVIDPDENDYGNYESSQGYLAVKGLAAKEILVSAQTFVQRISVDCDLRTLEGDLSKATSSMMTKFGHTGMLIEEARLQVIDALIENVRTMTTFRENLGRQVNKIRDARASLKAIEKETFVYRWMVRFSHEDPEKGFWNKMISFRANFISGAPIRMGN